MVRWLLLFIMGTAAISSFAIASKTVTLEDVRTQFLSYVNQYREEKGLEEVADCRRYLNRS